MTSAFADEASSLSSETASPSSINAAAMSDSEPPASRRNIIIIITVVVGIIVSAVAAFTIYGFRNRSSRLRLFRRAATPLSDAEFDRWRRPSHAPFYDSGGTTVYKVSGTRYIYDDYRADIKTPEPLVSVMRLDLCQQARPVTPPEPHRPRKISEDVTQSPASSTKPLMRNSSTRHSRRQSSMSLQDRPPTPYSPNSPPTVVLDADSPLASPVGVPQSPRQREHRVHVHYPSISEASDFDFGFNGIPGSPRAPPNRRRESFVQHSHTHSSTLSSPTTPPILSNFHMSTFESEDWKYKDFR